MVFSYHLLLRQQPENHSITEALTYSHYLIKRQQKSECNGNLCPRRFQITWYNAVHVFVTLLIRHNSEMAINLAQN